MRNREYAEFAVTVAHGLNEDFPSVMSSLIRARQQSNNIVNLQLYNNFPRKNSRFSLSAPEMKFESVMVLAMASLPSLVSAVIHWWPWSVLVIGSSIR